MGFNYAEKAPSNLECYAIIYSNLSNGRLAIFDRIQEQSVQAPIEDLLLLNYPSPRSKR